MWRASFGVVSVAVLLSGCSVTQRHHLNTLPPPSHHFPAQVQKAQKQIAKPVAKPVAPATIPSPHHLTFKERWGEFKARHKRWFR